MDNDLIDKLQVENEKLKQKLEETEQQLKKYTNGNNHKRYYEKNKEKVKENGLEENPDKLKEYRRNYYLKKKQKKK
jgi:cell division septum initiation protein DivIVA